MRKAIAIALCSGTLWACDQAVPPPSVVLDAGDDTGWKVLAAGTDNLNAVSGLTDKAVWVVGDHGTIGHWDGAKLDWEKSGTTANLRGVWALSESAVYAVGDGGTILKRDAAGVWTLVAAKVTREVLTSVWADSQRVIAVGSGGTIILGGATPYQLLANTACSNKPCNENLFGVTGTAGGAITVVGALGLVLSITGPATGPAIARVTIPNFTKLLSGITTGSANSYFVGQQGTVYRADATGLNPVAGCPTSALRSVSTVGPDAWIVGWDGTVCKVAGMKATSFPYSDTRWFNGIYAASATSLWVVGASGTLLHGLPLPPEAGP